MNFVDLKTAVQRQFLKMQDKTLLRVEIDGDKLWETYLSAFPVGANPKFRERTEHDCSCCRHFVRSIGGIVCIESGELVSVWNVTVAETAYQAVADAMAKMVKACPIANVYLSSEATVGTDRNFEKGDGEDVKTWEHFYLRLPTSVVVAKGDVGPKSSEARSTYDVMLRSLREIDLASIDTVLDLISQNSLYRGDEHKSALTKFRKMKVDFEALGSDEKRSRFCWSLAATAMPAVSRMRNTVIGTLLVDLAEGKELDDAVKSFEAKVAPANYKRPTALVTKAMIEKAKKTVEELGLTSALERRYATLDDISIRDLIFADRETRKKLGGTVFDEIAATKATSPKNFDKVEEIAIDDFIKDVIPQATSLEVMVENTHLNRLVSLIAPCDLTAQRLFKWGNNFSWSYHGDFADSIKERVKTAGGKVDGDLRCSLSWFNFDDLDLHMKEPGGYEIYYANRQRLSPNAGMLDVDMNAGGGSTREAVENICYVDRRRMSQGIYTLFVHNFCKRESVDVGFEVEVEFDGAVHTFAYADAVKDRDIVAVAKIAWSPDKGFKIVESLPSSQKNKQEWGISTNDFVPVSALMLSPNYWGESGQGTGNKHYFFMLHGCVNDGAARGFYNEFLTAELNQHRKVLELVGSKMKTKEDAAQLSGLGFSSTQRGHLLCRVKGSFTRVLKIVF